jgi:membrane fusion protein, heavy metal efflux system
MKYSLIVTISLLMLWSCSSETKPSEQQINTSGQNHVVLTDSQFTNAQIKTEKAELRNIATVLTLNGKIDVPPQNMVSVSMPMGGFLKTTQLLPGMHVKKGEVIATMEDQRYIEIQQEYLTARSNLFFLEKEYLRQKELNQSKASSDKQFQITEKEYQAQKITLSALAEKLKLINIKPESLNEENLSRSVNVYSSIDGYVSKVNVNIGKYLNPSDVMFELINPEDIHLNLIVFEKDLHKLAIGQKVIAYNNNQPDKKYLCEIILISQNLSPERFAEVHCHFKEYDRSLFPGMYMNAQIEIKSNQAYTLPDKAIQHYKGKDYVFIERGPREFELLEIQKGNSENNFTEISGLEGKDITAYRFVSGGAYQLLMQLKNKTEE